jgi:DNA-binding transcriptional MerR regulator
MFVVDQRIARPAEALDKLDMGQASHTPHSIENSRLAFKLHEALYCTSAEQEKYDLCRNREATRRDANMFRIGEFSKIGQVPGSLLRYYDQIGLLKPAHIDRWTGYRYYSARQLPRLHRILALKELGLTLDQIARLVDEEVSTAEIRGMLILKKAQTEQIVHEEQARLRQIDARLQQIDASDQSAFDIVLKQVPAQRYLSLRDVLPNADAALAIMRERWPSTINVPIAWPPTRPPPSAMELQRMP